MHSHDKLEYVLNALKYDLLVVDLYVEFVLDCIMHHNACTEAVLPVFVVPVSSECDWDAVPPVWVDVAKSITAGSDNAFDENMWLLIQV